MNYALTDTPIGRPRTTPEVAAGTLVAIPITDGDFVRPISILVRRGRSLSRAAEALIEVFGGHRDPTLAASGEPG